MQAEQFPLGGGFDWLGVDETVAGAVLGSDDKRRRKRPAPKLCPRHKSTPRKRSNNPQNLDSLRFDRRETIG
ncbi:hypothetical protein [Burkholderia stagnalis]|uniref:hypothetical protein n=1 Tax=Burkholderia stagnalis TaxID=1503054 RepID=UPI000F7FD0FC|nr:hypothetical protein [Burkholderia stagnalis]